MFRLPKKPTPRSLKIYTVDDSEYYMEIIKSELNKVGYHRVKDFNTDAQCLSEMTNCVPDVVVLNHTCCGEEYSGCILKTLKTNYKNVRIIILSEHMDVDIAKKFISEGVDDFIVKNEMSIFHFGNSLNKINRNINLEDLENWKSKRIKTLYIALIITVCILSVVCSI